MKFAFDQVSEKNAIKNDDMLEGYIHHKHFYDNYVIEVVFISLLVAKILQLNPRKSSLNLHLCVLFKIYGGIKI